MPHSGAFQGKSGSHSVSRGTVLLDLHRPVIFAPLMPTLEQELSISHVQAALSSSQCHGFLWLRSAQVSCHSRFKHQGTLVISTLGVGLALLVFSLTSSVWSFEVSCSY